MLCINGIYPVVGGNGTIGGCLGAEGVLLKFKFRGDSTSTWDGTYEDYMSTISYRYCMEKEAIRRVTYYNKVGSLDCADTHGVQYWGQKSGGQTCYVESEAWTLDMPVYSEGSSPIYLGLAQDCYKLCVLSGLLDTTGILSYPVTMRFKIWQYDITHTIQHDYTELEQSFRVKVAEVSETANYQNYYTVSLYIPLKSPTGIQDIVVKFEYLGFDGYVKVTKITTKEWHCESWFWGLYIHCWAEYETSVIVERDMHGPTLKGSLTKTWYCRELAVGGVLTPIDKLGLLAPYIGVASTITVATAATAICVRRARHRKEK